MKKVVRWMALVGSITLLTACGGGALVAEPEQDTVEEMEPLAEFENSQLASPTAQPMVEPAEEEMQERSVEYDSEDTADAVGATAPVEPEVAADEAAGQAMVGEEPPVEGGEPDDMFFEDYGTNPYVTVEEDNLSTFAIDVDTGSYTLTRSYLNDGYLPPAEAIRLEEFVNYFEQGYPLPQNQAFNIITEAAPAPFSPEDTLVMRVGIQGYEVPADERPDATLIFVVDISGSMNGGNRLGAVKAALNTLVDELRPTDQVGIVVYGSTGRVVLEPTPVNKKAKINKAIRQLTTDGSTNAEEGLRLAYQLATEYYENDYINRLILCSDGVANVGITGPEPMLEVVRMQARDGISLTTVGFGMGNYNDVLMEQLANDGDGQYFYVDSQDEAQRVFVDDLTGTLQTIARDAKIQVEFNPETVSHYRLMGYENRDVADSDFRNDEVDAGEIGAGHSVTALYEIVPVPQASGALATVHMRWEDPATGEVTEIEESLLADEVLATFEETDPHFQLDVAVAAFADVLSEGAWAQSADLQTIETIVGDSVQPFTQDTDVTEFMNLARMAQELGAGQ